MTTVCTFFAHGPRVQRAPGVPCALRFFRARDDGHPPGRNSPRECGGVFGAMRVRVLFGATSLPHSPLSCPASCGASSTPRLLGSSTGVSGILDRPIKSGDDGWSRGWGNWPWAGNPRRPGLEPGPITPNVYVALRWSSIPITAHSGGNGSRLALRLAGTTSFGLAHLQLSAVMPRFMRGIQYAAASRLKRWRLWNTGSPDQVGR